MEKQDILETILILSLKQLAVVVEVEELLIDSLQVEDDQVEQVEDVLLLNAEVILHFLVLLILSMELMVQQPQIVQEVEEEEDQ